MSRILDVYLHEEKTGQLTQHDDGRLTFMYSAAYLSATGPAISVAMPLREAPYGDTIARAFFSGLLPDERARERLAAALGVSRENAFGLLEIIGGECAGALTLVPKDTPLPDLGTDDAELLSEQRLADVLLQLRQRPLLGGEQGVRLSLAGAQDKLAICLIDDQIALPKNGRPTSHILKPFIEGLEGTVENELFCMTLAARVGLNAPAVAQGQAGDTRYLLVERYDRHTDANGLIRKRHQEDFCQALSIPPELKYEAEGGPGVAQAQALIQQHTQRPAADRLTLHRMLIFHYLVGNADAHAKNYALLYRSTPPELAPLYDVVCTAAYPRLSKHMAMGIGGRALPDTIKRAHWLSLVPNTKSAQRLLVKEMSTMAGLIEEEADILLADMMARDVFHPVLRRVRRVIEKRVKMVLKATAS